MKHVGNSCEAIFAPYICTKGGVIEREVMPSVAIGAVILAYRAPLAFAEIRSPFFKWYGFSGVYR